MRDAGLVRRHDRGAGVPLLVDQQALRHDVGAHGTEAAPNVLHGVHQRVRVEQARRARQVHHAAERAVPDHGRQLLHEPPQVLRVEGEAPRHHVVVRHEVCDRRRHVRQHRGQTRAALNALRHQRQRCAEGDRLAPRGVLPQRAGHELQQRNRRVRATQRVPGEDDLAAGGARRAAAGLEDLRQLRLHTGVEAGVAPHARRRDDAVDGRVQQQVGDGARALERHVQHPLRLGRKPLSLPVRACLRVFVLEHDGHGLGLPGVEGGAEGELALRKRHGAAAAPGAEGVCRLVAQHAQPHGKPQLLVERRLILIGSSGRVGVHHCVCVYGMRAMKYRYCSFY
eukprot:Rhum_TRINITY_DN10020_c0_g1::Rhum_TRINITY_DN10020_c0_g1_i1::g.36499::m.36499